MCLYVYLPVGTQRPEEDVWSWVKAVENISVWVLGTKLWSSEIESVLDHRAVSRSHSIVLSMKSIGQWDVSVS